MNDYAFRHRLVAAPRQRNLGAGGAFNVWYRRHEVPGMLLRIDSQPRPGVPSTGTGKFMAIGLKYAMLGHLSRLTTLGAGVTS